MNSSAFLAWHVYTDVVVVGFAMSYTVQLWRSNEPICSELS